MRQEVLVAAVEAARAAAHAVAVAAVVAAVVAAAAIEVRARTRDVVDLADVCVLCSGRGGSRGGGGDRGRGGGGSRGMNHFAARHV
jgi:hypothetical protein